MSKHSNLASISKRKKRKVNPLKGLPDEKFAISTIDWLTSYTTSIERKKLKESPEYDRVISLIRCLLSTIKNRGKEEGIALSKSWRDGIFNALAIMPDMSSKSVALARKTLPRRLRFIFNVTRDKHPIERTMFIIRLVLTVTYITRSVTLPTKLDVESIVTPPTVELDMENFGRYVKDFWKMLGYRPLNKGKSVSARLRFRNYHLSTKAGPNGHALWHSLMDLQQLPLELIKSIKGLGGDLISKRMDMVLRYAHYLPTHKLSSTAITVPVKDKETGKTIQKIVTQRLPHDGSAYEANLRGERLTRNYENLEFDLDLPDYAAEDYGEDASTVHDERMLNEGRGYRKVTAIPSQEGKTRVVAIADYWSQACLRPLHDYLFGVLRRIPADCTFNQMGFVEKLSKYKDNGSAYHSIDLTRATDRFPILCIETVLRPQLGDRYVNDWKTIMVGFPFSVKTKTGFSSVRYQAGNPMGLYSSWNSFALTHHYLVYLCCREIGLDYAEAPYVLLGDDICIKHDALAERYKAKLTSLGVDFSPSKTHVSLYAYEFAKRFAFKEYEVTPFPICALYTFRKKPVMLLNLLVQEARKGWKHAQGPVNSTILLLGHLGLPRSYRKKVEEYLMPIHQVLMILDGTVCVRDGLRPLCRKLLTEDEFRTIEDALRMDRYENVTYDPYEVFLSDTFKTFFKKSSESYEKSEKLSQIGREIYSHISEIPLFEPDDRNTLLLAIPHIEVYLQIIERFEILSRDEWKRATSIGEDWKFSMKAMTTPITDSIYVNRNQDLRVDAANRLASALKEHVMYFAKHGRHQINLFGFQNPTTKVPLVERIDEIYSDFTSGQLRWDHDNSIERGNNSEAISYYERTGRRPMECIFM